VDRKVTNRNIDSPSVLDTIIPVLPFSYQSDEKSKGMNKTKRQKYLIRNAPINIFKFCI